MNINRDYIINIALASSVDRGKVRLKKPIYFYDTDRHTQNIYLIVDTDITDMSFLLVFRNTEAHKVAGQIVGNDTVEFNIPYEYLQVIGEYEAEIVVMTDTDRMSSEQFTFIVKNSITRNGGK